MLIFGREELEWLNFSIFWEKCSDVFLSSSVGEALDVQVASLLRVFVFKCLMHELIHALFFPESGPNIKLVSVDFLIVHFCHGFFSWFWASLTVIRVGRTETNEEELAQLTGSLVNRCDVAEYRKEFFCIFSSPARWHVFHKNIVVHLSKIFFVSWRKFDTDDGVSILGHFKSLLSSLSLSEAYESVPSWFVVTVEGDLAGNYLSELWEKLVEIFCVKIFWDSTDEQVIFG